MDLKLTGKTALITGASMGIGAHVAETLAAEGVHLHLTARSAEKLETLKAEIAKTSDVSVTLHPLDLTSEGAPDALAQAICNVDILVNNAGGLIARKKIAEMELSHWEAVMTLNLTSTFMMTKACLAHMKSGSIVNLASQAGRDGGGPGAVAYATSKGAVMTMTRGLAKELGPNIRVNALCPGMIDTDFHNIHTPDAGRRGFEANAPLKRQGHVDDAANLVLFLACADSAFITGTNMDLNGGMLFS